MFFNLSLYQPFFFQQDIRKMKRFFQILFYIAISIFMIWGVTYYRQFNAFNTAEKLTKSGKHLDAIAFYETAIRMYTPGSKNVQKSVQAILTQGETFQNSNKIQEALIAFRALKTSLYAIRSFYSPYKEQREHAEKLVNELQKLLMQKPKKENSHKNIVLGDK